MNWTSQILATVQEKSTNFKNPNGQDLLSPPSHTFFPNQPLTLQCHSSMTIFLFGASWLRLCHLLKCSPIYHQLMWDFEQEDGCPLLDALTINAFLKSFHLKHAICLFYPYQVSRIYYVCIQFYLRGHNHFVENVFTLKVLLWPDH